MAKKRRQRVPEVLWRLFHHRARTLAETILSLVPPPLATAAKCRCKGRRCLSCSGSDAMLFLLRPKDPPDYRKLLNKCFLVVSENAPPITVFDPQCRWSQREVVTRTIEMISHEQPSSNNIICCSYDKQKRSSPIVGRLTSPAWCLLLKRVGDTLMVYLLKYTSVFLRLSGKKYHQVAGFPINDLCLKFSRHMPDSGVQHHPLNHNGLTMKRNELGVNSTSEKQLWSLEVKTSSDSIKSIGSTGKEPSNELPLKRKRQFRWQRQRKRRQLVSQGRSLISCTLSYDNNDRFSSGSTGQPRICLSPALCNGLTVSCSSCCSVFQNLPKIRKNLHVYRKTIFYRLECSSSLFPRKHILNLLKANDSGAISLFKNIFGTFDFDTNSQSWLDFQRKDCCLSRSTCLCNSLVKLLKKLIHKAKRCQYLRLLDKHCSTPYLNQDANRSACPFFEGNDSGGSFSIKEHDKAHLESKSFHVSDKRSCETISEATDYQFEPIKNYCLKKQVVSYIWAVCRSIVPPVLLGTTSNWRILRKNISRFISLRRFEKFSLNQCMHKLKISMFPLLSNKQSSCHLISDAAKDTKGLYGNMQKRCSKLDAANAIKHRILEYWIFWFFASLVAPLLQANFYITESGHEKQEVFYYRKSIWKKLMVDSVNYLKDKSYRQLNSASVRQILRNRSFGFSRARFCPKENGIRVLANLKASSRMPLSQFTSRVLSNKNVQRKASHMHRNVKYECFKSVNSVLRDLHVVFKGIRIKEQEKLGSSVFDYNDIYRKFVPFVLSLKDRPTNVPRAYVVVSDVSKAFDSVNQDRLLSVMKDVVLDDEFILEKSIQVLCTKKSLRVHQHLTLADQNIISKSAKSYPEAHLLDGILVKKVPGRKIKKEEIHFIFNEHIKRNVLHLDGNFYQQCVGITQGSVLSSLLCSFYYGHMDRNVIFPFLEKACEPDTTFFSRKHYSHDASASGSIPAQEMIACVPKYLLLRFIDDFLFLSTSKQQSVMFFSRLHRGIREYNCYMNEEKYGLNFDINQNLGLPAERLYVGEDGISFLRWSGLLLNCCTLEIQADYTRYRNSHLSSSLTVSWEGKVGHHLKAKLCDYLRPKCHPIFYDSNINSPAVVRLNIYQVFLLCAMKFHCYVANLFPMFTFGPAFFIKAIDTSLRYMHKLMKKRMHSLIADLGCRPKFDVQKKEIIWLGLYAYVHVLKKKQSRYKELLSLLRSKLMAQWKTENLSPALEYAVDDAHSSVFWNIKY